MIEHISELLANVMLNNKIISKSEYNWKKYGIELFLIQTGCIISSVLFCTLLGRTLECVLLLLFLMPLRSCIGGMHASKFSTCFILSNLTVILFSEVIHYCSHSRSDIPAFISMTIGIICYLFILFNSTSLKYLPKSDQNTDKIKHRKKTIMLTVMIIAVLSLYFRLKSCYISISCGLFVVSCSILAQLFLYKYKQESH